MQCPKCGSGVAANATTCSICFASIDEAPKQSGPIGLQVPAVAVPREEDYMPSAGIPGIDNRPAVITENYLTGQSQTQQAGSGEFRVSLTGEMIEVEAPTARQAKPGQMPTRPSGMPAAPIPARRPSGPAPAPSRSTRPRQASESYAQSSGGGGKVVVLVVLLMVLAGGGAFGGFWWWQKQHAPAIAVDQFMSAAKNHDWKTVYKLVELPAAQKAFVNETNFGQAMDLIMSMVTLKDYKVGDVSITGDTAKVKLTDTVETKAVMGMQAGTKTSTNEIPLRLVNGSWKIDGSSATGGRGFPGIGMQ